MPKPDPTPTDQEPTDAAAALADNADEFVAKGPIDIGGVRAYNTGDRVTAAAVERNNLQDQVKPSK